MIAFNRTTSVPHPQCIIALFCVIAAMVSLGAVETTQKDETFTILPDPAGRAYFPKGKESFYTRYLAAMKEPSLMAQPKSSDDFALRFTWLRSFHDPIAIRIWRDGKEYRIRSVRLAKQQDYSPGPKIKDETRILTKGEFLEIQRLTESKNLWKPLSDNEELLMAGNDGAEWIFERLNRETYSMIAVWSPSELARLLGKEKNKQPYQQAGIDISTTRDFNGYARFGLYLLKITNLLPKDSDVY